MPIQLQVVCAPELGQWKYLCRNYRETVDNLNRLADTSPNAHPGREGKQMNSDQEEAARIDAERGMHADFVHACMNPRVDAWTPMQWAPEVTNYGADRHDQRKTRQQTLGEILQSALDYPSGPTVDDALQIVLDLARGIHSHATLQGLARDLIKRAAGQWVDHTISPAHYIAAGASIADLPGYLTREAA